MGAPPAEKARVEGPAGAKSRQRAKEELQATEATLLRRHVGMLLPKSAVGHGKGAVEVMEKLAANIANLKEAEEKEGRRRSAPVPPRWEALRPLPSGTPRG